MKSMICKYIFIDIDEFISKIDLLGPKLPQSLCNGAFCDLFVLALYFFGIFCLV